MNKSIKKFNAGSGSWALDALYEREGGFELEADEGGPSRPDLGSLFDISDDLFEAAREAKREEECKRLPRC